MATTFPDVTLSTAFVAQQEYSSTDVKVLKTDDSVEEQSLRVFVQLGDNPSFKYWIPVLNASNYTSDWTNDTIATAVTEYFVNA